MSIYFRTFPDWDAFWENLKDQSVTDLDALMAMDEMAVFGARDAADSNSPDASAVLSGTKSAYGITGTTFDQALTDAYTTGYDNYGDFVASNPSSPLPPRPPR
jgi:hypothetical protein